MSLPKIDRNMRIIRDLAQPKATIRSVAARHGVHPSRIAYIKKREKTLLDKAFLSTRRTTGQ